MSVVTLGGMSGGGARVLGPIVAKRINGDYVDRRLLSEVARQVGSTVEVLQRKEENPPSFSGQWRRLFHRVLERSSLHGVGGDPYFGLGVASFLTDEYENIQNKIITSEHELSDDHYIEVLHDTIVRVASKGNVVIVGRGAHMILNDMDSVLRVGVVAHVEDRISRIMVMENLDRESAESTIIRRDEARAAYFKKVFKVENGDRADLFHLTVNTSEMHNEFAVDIISDSLQSLKEGKLVVNRG